ncbi:MAG: ATP-binding cassette domain-containing protein, partial [Phyllobacteriaceae bacterium]|nr:ATP-binding cassette domain-containing protein [Phyllobacteriaceae bacterium]
LDPVADSAALRPRIGVMLQEGGVPSSAKVGETLEHFARFYQNPQNPRELINLLGLSDVSATYRRMSGGEQQRLKFAIAIIGRPELVFLDEPTAGLDAHAKRIVWDVVNQLRASGVGIILTTGEYKTAALACQRIRSFKETGGMALHGFQSCPQRHRQFSAGLVSAEPGIVFKSLRLLRHVVGLLVINHLASVFEAAQFGVATLHVSCSVSRNPLRFGQGIQHGHGGAAAQCRVSSTGDELLCLDEELDLADAATAEFQVMALYCDLAMALHGMDLADEGLHILDRREVEILAPDIGAQTLEKLFAECDVARNGTGLDEGGAFPVLSEVLVIMGCRLNGDGYLRGTRVRSQAEVRAEDIAMFVHVLQQGDKLARDADRQRGGVLPIRHRHCLGIKENDQVDVTGIVQLVGAVLAHGEDDIAAIVGRSFRVRQLQLAGVV